MIMIAAGKIKSWKHDGLHCECYKDGLKEWLWKMVQCGKRFSYAIVPFPLSFLWNVLGFFKKDLAAKHSKLFFADLIRMFGCEPCCSMCYRLNTLQQVSCLWAQAGHRECTSWAHGSPDILLSGNSSELSTTQNQNSTWLKDTHTHWPLLQPWERCSSLKWLSRVAPTVWVLCKYWQGYCASEQSTF